MSLEHALHHIATAKSMQAPTPKVELLVRECCRLSAEALSSDVSSDTNAALAFWARALKAAGSSIYLQKDLRVYQIGWLQSIYKIADNVKTMRRPLHVSMKLLVPWRLYCSLRASPGIVRRCKSCRIYGRRFATLDAICVLHR